MHVSVLQKSTLARHSTNSKPRILVPVSSRPPSGPSRASRRLIVGIETSAAKLEALGVSGAHSSEAGERASATASRAHPAEGTPKNRRRSRSIDKSVLAMPEPRRVRDRDHVRLVAQQPCLICGRRPADAHHLRFAQSRALSRKVSDEFTVPLCRGHHREVHRSGDEAAWWGNTGVDLTVAARALWLGSHPLRMDQEEPTLNQGVFAPHLRTLSSL